MYISIYKTYAEGIHNRRHISIENVYLYMWHISIIICCNYSQQTIISEIWNIFYLQATANQIEALKNRSTICTQEITIGCSNLGVNNPGGTPSFVHFFSFLNFRAFSCYIKLRIPDLDLPWSVMRIIPDGLLCSW